MIDLKSVQHVVVGSTNPVKIAAVRAVLTRIGSDAIVEGIAVPSGVSDQPFGDRETQRGAENRARAALEATGGTLAVGLEGGVVQLEEGQMRTCAWAVALDSTGQRGIGGSLSMPLPMQVADLIHGGEELGHAMDIVARTVGTKHGLGAVGILTAGLIDRQAAYETLVTYALAPWLAPEFFALSGR